jgi:Preprotein translocase subunit SecA (ATPase, RNA helicase)
MKKGLQKDLLTFQNAPLDFTWPGLSPDDARAKIFDFLLRNYHAQAARLGGAFPHLARYMILNLIDENWRQHLFALDELQDVIGWRAYAGRDPLLEFKRESFELFQELLGRIEEQIISYLIKPHLKIVAAQPGRPAHIERVPSLHYRHDELTATAGDSPSEKPKAQPRRITQKVGRNDPCPCGSGKKYKHCCMK